MNISSSNQPLIFGAAGGVVVLLFILLVLLRKRSKKGKERKLSSTAESKTSSETNISTATFASPEPEVSATSTSFVESFLESRPAPLSNPEFGELFVVEDPLDGSGYLATQINRETSYISDFEIRALIKRFEAALLSAETLQSGFAEKSTIAGKVRTVLFGEVEAISKSTAAFHPEITSRIERAQSESAEFRLLAIDGLVYGVFEIRA